MQVTETSSQGLKREFKVVVPAADIAKRIEERVGELSRTANMPGFRPGKVPPGLVRKQYGQALRGEILEKAVGEGVQKAVEDRNLRPAQQPQIDLKTFGENEDLEFEIKLEVMPDLPKLEFGGIEIERLKVAIDDSQVEEALGRIAKANADQAPVDPPRPAQSGDFVKIDFEGFVDGVAFEGGKAEDYTLELGSGSFIPGFEDQLAGATVGEDRDIKVTFPAEYQAPNLAGKEATFKIKMKEIRVATPKAIDDELAKTAGFPSLEEMRKAVRERIEQDYTQVSRSLVKRKLLDKLADSHAFDLPEAMVEGEFKAIWDRVEEAKKAGEKVEGDEEKLKADYKAIAARRVRLGILLAEVGRSNNIQVTADEINRAVIREAQRFPGQERQVFEFYQKNQQMRENLRAPIYEDKTIDFILELAKVSDRSVSADDLLAAGRAADEEDAKKTEAA